MNDLLKEAARDAGIVVVEHVIQTSYSDDRAPYDFSITHNATFAPPCLLCQDVDHNMHVLASLAKGRSDGSHD